MGSGRCHSKSERDLVPARMISPEGSWIRTDVAVNIAVQPCTQSWDMEASDSWSWISGKICAVMATWLCGMTRERDPSEVMVDPLGNLTVMEAPAGVRQFGMSLCLRRKSVQPESAIAIDV